MLYTLKIPVSLIFHFPWISQHTIIIFLVQTTSLVLLWPLLPPILQLFKLIDLISLDISLPHLSELTIIYSLIPPVSDSKVPLPPGDLPPLGSVLWISFLFCTLALFFKKLMTLGVYSWTYALFRSVNFPRMIFLFSANPQLFWPSAPEISLCMEYLCFKFHMSPELNSSCFTSKLATSFGIY